jgi:hypothetical protein
MNSPSHAMATDSTPPTPEPKPASLPQLIGAVFWSFFGVRKGTHMAADSSSIKPLHVILVGLGLAAVLVLALIVLVRIIIANAG